MAISVSLCSDKSTGNKELFKLLKSDLEWNMLEKTDDMITISIKNLPGSDLNAVKVEKTLQLNPGIVSDIIMDLDNYNRFLSNAQSLDTKIISRSDNNLIGYQHISIDIPFFDDREYLFQISKQEWIDESSTILCHWMLLDYEDTMNNKEIMKQVTYLSYGAGVWQAKYLSPGNFNISYRLYMDPGGSIPDFLIDIINRESIVGLFRDVEREVISRSRSGN